jgi:oligogalacturonide lyase
MILAALLLAVIGNVCAEPVELAVSPPEHRKVTDEVTGAELLYLTTNPVRDVNLYFHEWSWLSDNSMILFYSDREQAGSLTGYLTATGELVCLATPAGAIGSATAAVDRPSVYGLRGKDIVELALRIESSAEPASAPSKVRGEERVLAAAPEGILGALNPNSDGSLLAFGVVPKTEPKPASIMTVNTATGELRTACVLPPDLEFSYHVQWNHQNPYLLNFASLKVRLNVVDIRDGQIRHPYLELPGELVTHEHWWGANQLVFCGGLHPKPTEDAHVKVLNVETGEVRILGAGSWWPEATPEEVSKFNFWHCAGSDNGRWVVADNWHGDITLFEAKTTRPHLLAAGHRTYGKGDHPHVGWDRKGEQVIFTSYTLGDANVCVATIPKAMQEANITPPWPGR